MPQLPESLEPKSRRSGSRVEIEWQTVSYRAVALVALLLVAGTSTVLYFLYPEQVKTGIARLLASNKPPDTRVEQKQAHFLNIEGNVRVKKANAIQWVPASPNIPLEKGDVVQASADGVARISFADGTVYTVRPDTLIVVEENSSITDSKTTNVAVQVTSGEVDLSTTKFNGQSKVTFANATASIGQDSKANVRTDPKAQTSAFTMAQGHAELVRGTERMTLGSYEQVAFQGDKAPTRQRVAGPPLLLIPASGAPVVAPETGRTEVSFSWTPVPMAKSYRLRISTSPIFTTLTYDKQVSSSSVKITALPMDPKGTTYYWAVSSVDDRGHESQTSDASKFTLLRPSGSGEILLEVDNIIQHGKSVEIIGRTEPGARIMVNDEPVFGVLPDGTFKHFSQPFASAGANQITVTAQNAKGQIATLRKTVYIQ